MKKYTYKRVISLGMTMCLLTCVTACGSENDDYYGEEITYSEDWEYEEGAEETDETYETDQDWEGEMTEEEWQDESEDYSDGFPYEEEDLGVTLMLPEEYMNAQGIMYFDVIDLSEREGVYYAQMNYTGIPADEVDAMFSADEVSDEDAQRYNDSIVPVFTLLAATENRSIQKIIDYVKAYKEVELEESNFYLLNSIDDYSIYQYKGGTPANYNNIDDSLKPEYEKLVSITDDMLAKSIFVRPVTEAEKMVGKDVSFTTTDLDGNSVSSEDIFGNYDVTMLNVWGTWCGFCIGELEELEKINNNLAGKNCAIVGLCGDAWDSAKIKEAKEILKAYGVTYYNICPYEGWEDVFEMSGWPSSFFIGRDGKMVAAPIYGAEVAKYEPYIDDILAGKVTAVAPKTNSYANDSGAYTFYVVDEAGYPVEGAMVQFCSNSTCKIQPTDETGIATFKEVPGVYEVHLAKVPDGYRQNSETLKTEDYYCDMVFVVQKE